jgi:hypothetical protein
VLAVRVSFNTYGEVLGALAVTDIRSWNSSKDWSYFYLIVFSYIIIAMGVPLFVISLLYYVRQRESQEYLYYCLQLICGLLVIIDHSTSWNLYGTILTRFKVLGYAWAALNVTHPIFLHRIYGLERKPVEVLLWLYLAVVLFIGTFFTTADTLYVHGLLLIVFTTSLGFIMPHANLGPVFPQALFAAFQLFWPDGYPGGHPRRVCVFFQIFLSARAALLSTYDILFYRLHPLSGNGPGPGYPVFQYQGRHGPGKNGAGRLSR